MPESKHRKNRRVKRLDRNQVYTSKIKPQGWTSIFFNVKLFYIVGSVIMVGGLIGGALAIGGRNRGNSAPPPVAEATPTPEEGVKIKQYEAPPAMTIDANKKYTATIRTEKGDIKVELYAKEAPITVNNFVFLAKDGFYSDIAIDRVEPGFVVQMGDRTGTGLGGPGYVIPQESSGKPFTRGTIAMALRRDEPGTAGSQFFILLADENVWDAGRYAAFGKVADADLSKLDSLEAGDRILSIDVQAN